MRRHMKARTSQAQQLNGKVILSDGDRTFSPRMSGRQIKITQFQSNYKSHRKWRSESSHHEATVGYIMKCNSSGTLLLMQKTAAAT